MYLYLVTTASFKILSRSLFASHPDAGRCRIRRTGSAAKYSIKMYDLYAVVLGSVRLS
jgi:hypothetical protein